MKKQYRIMYNEYTEKYKVQDRYVSGWFNIFKTVWLDEAYDFTTLEEAKLKLQACIDWDNKMMKQNTWKVLE